MSGINSIGGHPAGPRDLFSRVDSDRSGGVSQGELQKLSDAIADRTGKTIDAGSEAFKGYDSDGNGSLSGEELKAVLDSSGFGPSRGMQGMAPPPPPPQRAAGSYTSNTPASEQEALQALVTGLQGLLDTLNGGAATHKPNPGSGTPPQDIFGMVDTDRSGSLSKDELKALAKSIKETTGQTLDVSSDAISALDRNGDGELSPDEIDLRKTLSLPGADLGQNPADGELKASLEHTWQSAQDQQPDSAGKAGSTLLDQMNEVKSLLEILTRNYNSDGGSSRFSTTS